MIDLSENDFIKFIDGPKHDFERIVGYCSRWSDVLKIWGRPHLVSQYGGLINVPYRGNMYKIHYTKPTLLVPFDLHTAGYPGPPTNKLPKEHLHEILAADNYRDAKSIYIEFGYEEESFERDILRNIEAVESTETLEIIINVNTLHEFIAAPDHEDHNGGHIYIGPDEDIKTIADQLN